MCVCLEGWDELKDESDWSSRAALEDEYNPENMFTLGSEPCSRIFSRGVLWTWDGEEREVIQPCPADAQGVAIWTCTNQGWEGEAPNLSGCKSNWVMELTRDIEVSPGTRVISDLAAFTRSHVLYGGDILQTLMIIRTLRAEQEQGLVRIEDREQRETLAAEYFHSLLLISNNLLRTDQTAAWKDLTSEQRSGAGNSLIQELLGTAKMLSPNLGSRDRFEQRTEHVQNSIRVFNSNPEKILEFLELGGTQAKVLLQLEDLIEVGGSIKSTQLIFFSYEGLDKVLPSSLPRVKFLNSDIVSVLYARETEPSLTFPLRVTLEHRDRNVSSSSCVTWDTSIHSWIASNCQVESTNESHTTCTCHTSPATIALLAEINPTEEELDDDLGSLLGILLAVVTGVFLTFLTVLLTWKFCVNPGQDKRARIHVSCICKEGEEEDYYPNINSSPTSTTLSDDPTQASSYSLSKDLVFPSPLAPQSIQPPVDQCLFHRPQGHQSVYRSVVQRSDRNPGDHPPGQRFNNQQPVHISSDQQTVYRYSDHQAGNSDQYSMYRTLMGDESSLYRSGDQGTLYRHRAEPSTLNRPGEEPFTQYKAGAEPSTLYRLGAGPTLYRAKREDINTLSGVLSPILRKEETNHYFRPVSPSGHIYMEIDPVFSEVQNQDGDPVYARARDTDPQFQPSDISDDDQMRVLSKTISRYSEDQPLLRTHLRRSNPVRSCQLHNSSTFRGISRFGDGGVPNLETPIMIALTQEGNEYVSLNLERGFGRRTLPPEFCRSQAQLRRK